MAKVRVGERLSRELEVERLEPEKADHPPADIVHNAVEAVVPILGVVEGKVAESVSVAAGHVGVLGAEIYGQLEPREVVHGRPDEPGQMADVQEDGIGVSVGGDHVDTQVCEVGEDGVDRFQARGVVVHVFPLAGCDPPSIKKGDVQMRGSGKGDLGFVQEL